MSIFRKIHAFFNSPLHHWQKGEDFLIRKFLGQMRDDKQGRFFGEPLFKRMEDESGRLKSQYNRLALINWALLAILLASVFNIVIQINLLGLTLRPDTVAREILLVVSANLGAVASAVYMHAALLRTLVVRARSVPIPDSYSLALVDRRTTAELLSEAMFTFLGEPGFGSRLRRLLGAGLVVVVILIVLTQVLLYLAVGIAIHVAVMVDIWNNPSLSIGWSHVVVVYAVVLDTLSVTLGLLMSVISLRYRNSEVFAEFVRRSAQSETEAQLYLEGLWTKASRGKSK